MRSIRISDQVWDAIAQIGKFGETEDDVLRRVFSIGPANQSDTGVPSALDDALARSAQGSGTGRYGRGNKRFATKRMSARVEGRPLNRVLTVEFPADRARKEWVLPEKSDKAGIRRVRDEAVRFALDNGASQPGQTNAVIKALTDAGFHLTK